MSFTKTIIFAILAILSVVAINAQHVQMNQYAEFQYEIVGNNLVGSVNVDSMYDFWGVGFNLAPQFDGSYFVFCKASGVFEAIISGTAALPTTPSVVNTGVSFGNDTNECNFTFALSAQVVTGANVTLSYLVSESETPASISAVGVFHGIFDTVVLFNDVDGDGYDADSDCNDMDAKINPSAVETCDGVDQNCNGMIDEGVVGCEVHVVEVAPFRSSKRSALINKPTGLVYYNLFVYALDQVSFVIRQIDPLRGTQVVFAGQEGIAGTLDGIGAAASFTNLVDVALAASVGDLYVIDGQVIRKVHLATAEVTTLSGVLTDPQGIATNLSGRRVYVADQTDHVIYLLTEGTVSVFAGQVGVAGYNNGAIATATFTNPEALTLDSQTGLLYIGEQFGSIRVTDGINVSQFAGQPGNPGSAVGPALGGGQIGEPYGLLFLNGILYVTDITNDEVRVVVSGQIASYAGSSAVFNTPYGITALPPFLFVADSVNGVIVKIGTCNAQGISTGSQCNCFDGFSGTECEITPLASCNLIVPSPDALTSSVLPVANAALTFYKADTLHFALDTPLVQYRVGTFDFHNGATCPNTFVEVADYTSACSEQISVTVPWVDRVACGFVRDNTDPIWLIWRGEAQAHLRDLVGQLRNQIVVRSTVAKYRVAVRFPRTVNVTVFPLNVLSDVNLLAAITYQAIDTTVSPANATFSFTTSLQWPYQVNVYSLTSAPNGWSISTIVETTSVGMCPMTPGSICMQTFDVFIQTDAAACNIDGNYVYSADITCRTVNCPTFTPATVIAMVDSEDFCVEVDATADLGGTLALYRDVARSVTATNFAQFDTAYFRAQLTSTSTIEQVDLIRVSYWKPGATASTLIYDRDSVGIVGGFTFAEETAPTVGQSYSDFNFVLDAANFPQWPEDVVSFRVDATIEATFQDTAKRSEKKVFDFSFEQSIAEQSSVVVNKVGQLGLRGKLLMVSEKQTPATESSASSVAISMIVVLASIVFTLLF